MPREEWVRGKIRKLERRTLSRMGNPRFWVYLTDGTRYTTQTDGSVGYSIENPEYRGPVEVKLRNGVIVDIRALVEEDD